MLYCHTLLAGFVGDCKKGLKSFIFYQLSLLHSLLICIQGFSVFPPPFFLVFFLSYSKSQSPYLFKFQYSIFQLKSTRRVYTAHQVSHSRSPFFFQTNHFTLLFFLLFFSAVVVVDFIFLVKIKVFLFGFDLVHDLVKPNT